MHNQRLPLTRLPGLTNQLVKFTSFFFFFFLFFFGVDVSKNLLCQVLQHSFVQIDHMVIVSLPLIQEGQLPVSGERMSTNMVNCLED